MNCLRASLLASLAPVLLAASLAQAGTIKVTTLADLVADDDVCSIREAVEASRRSTLLLTRDGSRTRLEEAQEELEAQMAVRLQFPNESSDRSAIMQILGSMENELIAQEPKPADVAVRDNLLLDVLALQAAVEGLPDDKVYLCSGTSIPACTASSHVSPSFPGGAIAGVTQTHALVGKVVATAETEIARLEKLDEADGCDDGAGFDTILIPEGVHVLDSELVLTQRIDIDGVGDESIIEGSGLSRLIRVERSTVVAISDLQLRKGDAIAGDDNCAGYDPGERGDGGALCVRGSLSLSDVLLVDNQARDGGAVFVDAYGSLVAEKVRFHNNRASRDGGAVAALSNMSFTDSEFGCEFLPAPAVPGCDPGTNPGNSALGRGGAIYFNPQTTVNPDITPYVYQATGGNLSLERVLFFGNQADTGSAIATGIDGSGARFVNSRDSDISLVNVTLGQNVAVNGATIAYDTAASQAPDSSLLSLNNVTLIDNDGGAGTGGIRAIQPVSIKISNSLLADNAGGGADPDCDLAASTPDDNKFNRNYYRFGSACPGLRNSVNPLYTNFALGNGVAAIGYLVQDMLDPTRPYYLPIFPDDYTDLSEVRLVARGATTEEPFGCAQRDQRNLERQSFVDADCDIGAIEYQVGRRAVDWLQILVNETACLPVSGRGLSDMGVGNDVGDADYVVGSLRVLAVERAGARAIVASRNNVAAYQGANIPVVPLDAANCPNFADLPADVEEAILFTPPSGFQGETNVTYSLAWSAGTAQPVNGVVQSVAHIRTESRGGFRSEELGAAPLGWFLILSLLGLRQLRRRHWLALVPLLALTMPAQALENIIYVTSMDDPEVVQNAAGDGLCTLREALETARNDTENPTAGDCVNGNEGPDIIEFAWNDSMPTDLIVELRGTLTAYGGVTIRCPVDKDPALRCWIRGDGTFPLINSQGSIAFEGMVLTGGNAGAGNGGAVNSFGAVAVRKSFVTNNSARVGGAIFLRGPSGDVAIFDSFFVGNQSTGSTADVGGGGVLAMINGTNHKVTISGSTFYNNMSVRQAAVLNIKTTSPTLIVNSTFSGNSSTQGSGAIDLSDARSLTIMRNVTIVDNRSGDADGTEYFAVHVGAAQAQHRLYNSIVASNFDAAAGNLDRNCSDAAGSMLSSMFTLYGENPLAPTCPAGIYDRVEAAATVYNGTNTGAYLRTLEDNGFPYAQTHAANLLTPGVIGAVVDAGYNLALGGTAAANLVPPLDANSAQCADVDQRGKSRVAGGRCDIGAVEYEMITATADSGSNRNRHDRMAISDILANDLAEEGRECKTNRVGSQYDGDLYPTLPDYEMTNFPPAPVFPQQAVWAYDDRSSPMKICALVTFNVTDGVARFLPLDPKPTANRPDRKFIVDGDEWDDEIDTTSQFVLSYTDCNSQRDPSTVPCTTAVPAPIDFGDDWANKLMEGGDARVLQYLAGDVDGRVSAPGEITFSILNVPPWVLSDVVYLQPGQTGRINILANDRDYDAGIDPAPLSCVPSSPTCVNPVHDSSLMPPMSPTGLDLSSIQINSCNKKPDITDIDGDGDVAEDYYACLFGDVFLDRSNGELVWIPRNKFNPFSEEISYQVSDYAFPTGSAGTATVRFVVVRPEGSGGGMFGDTDLSDFLGIDFLGAAGHLFLGVLGLTALRRRRG